jgi:hypothetical protein
MNAQDGSFDSATEIVTYSIDTTGLSDGSYDLYVYGWDAVPNYNTGSLAFATLIIDSIAPANITDLSVVTTAANLITLTWTAPGDDGMSGTATSYEVRYSTTGPINDGNWNSATEFLQSWTPLPGGSTETYDVTGLTSLTTYWFAIKTADEVPTWSGVFISPTGATLADTLAPQSQNVMIDGQSSVSVNPGVVLTLTATISDAMMGNSDVSGSNCTIGSQQWPGTAMIPSDGSFDSPIEMVTLSVDTTGWNEGTYNLYVYGWDAISNYNITSSIFASITIDSIAPETNVNTILQYWQITSPLTITASGSTLDVLKVTLWFRFSEDGTSWDSWSTFAADSTAPWSWNFNFPDGEGHYEFYSIAEDLAGNTENDPLTADASCGYDALSPTSSVDDILTYWSTTSPLSVTAMASDGGSGLDSVNLYYRFSTNNNTWGSWTSFEVLTGTPFEWSFDFPEGEGYYQFYTVALDLAANEEEGKVSEAFCGYDVTIPSADAGSDKKVKEGDEVTFDGSDSSDNVKLFELTWTFEDGTLQTLTGVNPTYTFSTPGNYLVTLTISDAVGNSNTDTMWVNVSGISTTGSITGVIEDENGNPISGATVSVYNTDIKVVTDEEGRYTIQDMPEGTYDLTVAKEGYETIFISDVMVNEGQDTQNDAVSLEKSPKEESEGLPDYLLILLLIIAILAIVLLIFMVRSKKKATGTLEDLEPELPSEETQIEESQVPSIDEEQKPISDDTPSPEELPQPEKIQSAEKEIPPP